MALISAFPYGKGILGIETRAVQNDQKRHMISVMCLFLFLRFVVPDAQEPFGMYLGRYSAYANTSVRFGHCGPLQNFNLSRSGKSSRLPDSSRWISWDKLTMRWITSSRSSADCRK